MTGRPRLDCTIPYPRDKPKCDAYTALYTLITSVVLFSTCSESVTRPWSFLPLNLMSRIQRGK